MSWSKIGIVALGIAISGPSAATPTSGVVNQAINSVFLVTARNCVTSSGNAPARTGTGFAVQIDGSPHLVTSLHVVAGCKKWEIEANGGVFGTAIRKVYRQTDLALLEPPPGLTLPTLPLAGAMPTPGSSLVSLGRGQTATVNANEVSVRLAGARTITELVKNATTLLALEKQGFPSTEEPIVNLQGHLLSGDSGAPLINDSGAVAGVANGHLMQGLIPYSWAFPAETIRQLLVSTETAPSAQKLSSALAGEELSEGARLPAAGSSAEIQCGVLSFKFAGSQRFADVTASADPFSLSHIALVQSYAANNGKTIPPNARFDVYIDAETGADFAVPAGLVLTQVGDDCVGRDPANQLEARFSTVRVAGFDVTAFPAMQFADRTAQPGEFKLANPQFSTPPIPRGDGMIVQRYAFAYQRMSPSAPQSQNGQYPPQSPPQDGYLTFAYRNGVMLSGSVRSLVSGIAWTNNGQWFPALAGLYATAFAY